MTVGWMEMDFFRGIVCEKKSTWLHRILYVYTGIFIIYLFIYNIYVYIYDIYDIYFLYTRIYIHEILTTYPENHMKL